MWLELGTKHQKTLMKDPKTPQWNMAALCRTALAALAAFVALAPRSVLGGKHWTISSSWKMGSIRRRGPGSCWTHDFQIRTTLGAQRSGFSGCWIQISLETRRGTTKPWHHQRTVHHQAQLCKKAQRSKHSKDLGNLASVAKILEGYESLWGLCKSGYKITPIQQRILISLGGALFQTS